MDLITQRRDTKSMKSAPASKPAAESKKSSRTEQALAALREPRKLGPSRCVGILGRTVGRLEHDTEQRKAEGMSWYGTVGRGRWWAILLRG